MGFSTDKRMPVSSEVIALASQCQQIIQKRIEKTRHCATLPRPSDTPVNIHRLVRPVSTSKKIAPQLLVRPSEEE